MERKQTIETIEIDRQPVCCDFDRAIADLDPLQSLSILFAILTLLSALKRLFRLLKKPIEQKSGYKFDPKLVLQIVGTVVTIIKAIGQLMDNGDRGDE